MEGALSAKSSPKEILLFLKEMEEYVEGFLLFPHPPSCWCV